MTVAVKIAELTAPSGQAKAQLTEAKIATSLQHPNVVGVIFGHVSRHIRCPEQKSLHSHCYNTWHYNFVLHGHPTH